MKILTFKHLHYKIYKMQIKIKQYIKLYVIDKIRYRILV